MAGPAWQFRMEPETEEMALVPEQAPDRSSDRRVVAIITPPSAHSFAPSGGFERFQGLHRQKRAAMHLTQQEQDITGQMGQSAIALLIFAPASIDLPPIA